MSGRLTRVAAGLITLLIAGAAVACPGAMDKSAQGQGSSAQTTSSTTRG